MDFFRIWTEETCGESVSPTAAFLVTMLTLPPSPTCNKFRAASLRESWICSCSVRRKTSDRKRGIFGDLARKEFGRYGIIEKIWKDSTFAKIPMSQSHRSIPSCRNKQKREPSNYHGCRRAQLTTEVGRLLIPLASRIAVHQVTLEDLMGSLIQWRSQSQNRIFTTPKPGSLDSLICCYNGTGGTTTMHWMVGAICSILYRLSTLFINETDVLITSWWFQPC